MTEVSRGWFSGVTSMRPLLVGAWLLVLVGCGASSDDSGSPGEVGGGGERQPTTPASDFASEAPAGPAQAVGSNGGGSESAQIPLPAAPQAVFRDSRPSKPAWFIKIQKRVDAGPRGDAWPTEAFALWAEDKWSGLLDGKLPADGVVSSELQAPKRLVPNSWKELPESSCLQGRQSRDFEDLERLDQSGWMGTLLGFMSPPADQLGGKSSERGSMVQVYRASSLGDQKFQISVRMRVWNRDDEGGWCRTLESSQVWLDGKTPQLIRFEPSQVQDAWSAGPMFKDLTRHVLPETLISDHSLYAGGTELAGRHDRLFAQSTQYLGMHGLAVGDVNGDGLEDLYVARAAGFANHLFIRQADGTLKDGALDAGVADLDDTGGVLICDLDGDGARDLVAGLGPLVVVSWNDGKGTFSRRSTLTQGPDATMVYSICAADADGDGDLDLYDTRYFQGGRGVSAPTPYHDANNGAPNSYWLNDGARGFTEATKEAGLDMANRRFSLAALWEDLDGDGDLDLYVTNDFGRNNLYRNDGGRFVDIAESSDALDMAASMGISAADVDRDGNLDLYISNMYTPAGERIVRNARFQQEAAPAVRASYLDHARGNTLLMGQGNGEFEFRGDMAGTGPGGWSWGAVFMDFDMNGLPDLVVPNGFATGKNRTDLASFFWRVVVSASPVPGASSDEYLQGWQCITQTAIEEGYSWNGHERHYAYWNMGDGRFTDISAISGLDLLEDGRCAAVVDWDLDGKPDLWLAHRSAPVMRFMHNRIEPTGHWISLELQGKSPNTEAIGALVQVQQGSSISEARVYAGEGYLGGGSKRRLFGLASDKRDVTAKITWPNGEVQELTPMAVDHLYRVRQGGKASVVSSSLPSLAAVTGGQAPRGSGRALQRIVPAARLPLSAWDLPDFSQRRPTVGDLGPEPVLVYVYGGWQGGGSRRLPALAEAQAGSSYSLRLVSLDGPRSASRIQKQLDKLGLLSRAGRGGRRVRNLVDMILGEVIGTAKGRDLPIGLLFDHEGALAAIYMDGIPLEQAELDAQALRKQAAGANPLGLAGGRWFGPKPPRAILPMAAYLRRAGEARLADGMEAWVAKKAQDEPDK